MERFSPRQKLIHTDALCGVDPHRDPHGETSGRNTWSKEFPTASFLGQKRPQTLMPQRLGGLLSLGKDEVGGSNPPSSSKKSCFREKTGLLLCLFCSMGEGLKQSGRMLLPLRKIRLAYRANSACHTVIIFSHSIYSSANSDSTREGLQIYPISICPRSVMGTLTRERRRSSCVR